MKAWLKGGLIGFIIQIIVIIYLTVITIFNLNLYNNWYLAFPFSNLTDKFLFLGDPWLASILGGLLSLFSYFLIGALIGLIIQKIKKS